MIKIKFNKLGLLLILLFCAFSVPAKRKISNIFYAQNTLDWFQNGPKSDQEKALLLKSIGYDGLEGFGYSDFFLLSKVLRDNGLKMPVNYVSLNVGLNGTVADPSIDKIREMISNSEKGSIIYFQLTSDVYKNDRSTGDKVIVTVLQGLSDFAKGYGIRLSTYPHLSCYCETVEYSVKLAKMVHRKNYGATMNLCHLLKVEGSKDIDSKIIEYAPWLFAVNICGSDDGDTQQMDWDRLIQPLGQGSFDTYHFVKLLLDNGYKGAIGLQCYNLKGDAKQTLLNSLQTWNSFKLQYKNQK